MKGKERWNPQIGEDCKDVRARCNVGSQVGSWGRKRALVQKTVRFT